jgi:hypothetical protein
MSTNTAYTVEVYKKDGRIKKDERFGRNKAGLRFVKVMDLTCSYGHADCIADSFRKEGLVAFVYETFVARKNLLSGKEYQERYDTPHYCSPSSESYWSA